MNIYVYRVEMEVSGPYHLRFLWKKIERKEVEVKELKERDNGRELRSNCEQKKIFKEKNILERQFAM